jgi:addiction module antitoxin, RelB/DinJ family
MTVQVTTRIDKETKQQFDKVCEQIGVSPSNALSIFIRGVVNHNGIPFNVTASPEKLQAEKKAAVRPPFEFDSMAWEEDRKLTREEAFGCMRGQFKISDDFDAPLEDFKEYME